MIDSEADPGSVKRGGGGGNPNSSMPRPKITKIGQKNKKSAEKGGGGRGRFGPPPGSATDYTLQCCNRVWLESHTYQDITSDSSSILWFVPIEICTWLDWLDSTRTLKWDQMTRLDPKLK